MVANRKSTSNKNNSLFESDEQWGQKMKSDPKYKDMYNRVISLCGDREKDLLHCATVAFIHLNSVIEENKKLCVQLNEINDKANIFSIEQANPNVTVFTKIAIAELLKKENLQGPSDISFLSGVHASKKISAKKSSDVRTEKYKVLQDFAITEFLKKNDWRSLAQARDALWPKVHQEARLRGTILSVRTGPGTLYKWLLAYKKSSVA